MAESSQTFPTNDGDDLSCAPTVCFSNVSEEREKELKVRDNRGKLLAWTRVRKL